MRGRLFVTLVAGIARTVHVHKLVGIRLLRVLLHHAAQFVPGRSVAPQGIQIIYKHGIVQWHLFRIRGVGDWSLPLLIYSLQVAHLRSIVVVGRIKDDSRLSVVFAMATGTHPVTAAAFLARTHGHRNGHHNDDADDQSTSQNHVVLRREDPRANRVRVHGVAAIRARQVGRTNTTEAAWFIGTSGSIVARLIQTLVNVVLASGSTVASTLANRFSVPLFADATVATRIWQTESTVVAPLSSYLRRTLAGEVARSISATCASVETWG